MQKSSINLYKKKGGEFFSHHQKMARILNHLQFHYGLFVVVDDDVKYQKKNTHTHWS